MAEDIGKPLTLEAYEQLLDDNIGAINGICFLGGDHCEDQLIELLESPKTPKYRCVYTGSKDISDRLKSHLTHYKVGPWIEKLGPLSSKTTNQRFYELKGDNWVCNNEYFQGVAN